MRNPAKDAAKAKKMGIVDQIIKPLGPGKVSTIEYLEQCSIDFAKQLADGTLKRKSKKPNVSFVSLVLEPIPLFEKLDFAITSRTLRILMDHI